MRTIICSPCFIRTLVLGNDEVNLIHSFNNYITVEMRSSCDVYFNGVLIVKQFKPGEVMPVINGPFSNIGLNIIVPDLHLSIGNIKVVNSSVSGTYMLNSHRYVCANSLLQTVSFGPNFGKLHLFNDNYKIKVPACAKHVILSNTSIDNLIWEKSSVPCELNYEYTTNNFTIPDRVNIITLQGVKFPVDFSIYPKLDKITIECYHQGCAKYDLREIKANQLNIIIRGQGMIDLLVSCPNIYIQSVININLTCHKPVKLTLQMEMASCVDTIDSCNFISKTFIGVFVENLGAVVGLTKPVFVKSYSSINWYRI